MLLIFWTIVGLLGLFTTIMGIRLFERHFWRAMICLVIGIPLVAAAVATWMMTI